MIAHIGGVPVEETLPQLAPVAAVTVTVIAIVARTSLGRWRNRVKKR